MRTAITLSQRCSARRLTAASVVSWVAVFSLAGVTGCGDDGSSTTSISTPTTVASTTASSMPSGSMVAGTEPTGAAAFLGPVSQLEVNGIQIGYRQFGTGPELLMIVGDAVPMSIWTVDLLQGLAENFHVTIFDNRGVGYSTDDLSKPITVPLMADDTAGLIAGLGLDRPTVLGWSMGGEIGLTLAVTHPESLSRLITTGGDTGGSSAPQPTAQVTTELTDPNTSSATLLQLLFPADPAAASTAFVQQYELQTQEPVSPSTLQRQAEAEAAWATYEGTYEGLSKVKIPVLVTQGAEDIVVPPGNADVIKSRIPTAQVEVFEGAGHGMAFQDTPRFVALVAEFSAKD